MNEGKVVQVIGPVIDEENFEGDDLALYYKKKVKGE